MLDMDDWLRTIDFDASPLEAYNLIMSDQAPPQFDQ